MSNNQEIDKQKILAELQKVRRQNDSFGVGTELGDEILPMLEELEKEGTIIAERSSDGSTWWRAKI